MMSRKNPFKGLGIAMATPFRKDGSLDAHSLRSLMESLIANGADFICVLGTTAETPTLSEEERAEVRRIAVEVNQGRVPLLLGAGGYCTGEVCRFLQTTDLEGFDGVLIVTPYYNKPSQEGLYQHFKAVSESSPLPVVLYNVPGRTGVNLQAETTLRIAQDCTNVVAIKEASGNLGQIDSILRCAPEGFEVLSGDDAITLELLSIGAVGVISVIGNAFPKEFGQMVHSMAERGDLQEAVERHRRFAELFALMTADGNPAGIKALLSVQGKAENVLRLPLVPAREETVERIKTALLHF